MRHCSRIAAWCLAISLLLPAVGWAKKQQLQNLDFGAITCKEFISEIVQGDEDGLALVLMWLDGYLSGVSGDTVIKWNGLEQFSNALVDTCAKRPGKKVLDVAKDVGINR